MIVYVDTEFTNLGRDAELISIGCITASGDKFYGEITDYNKYKCSDFVNSTVIPNLFLGNKPMLETEEVNEYGSNPVYYSKVVGTKYEVTREIRKFINKVMQADKADKVTFVSDVCQYDGVLVHDLFKNMNDELAPYINPMMIDVSSIIFKNMIDMGYANFETEAFDMNREFIAGIKGEPVKHNALWDAYVIMIVTAKQIDVIDASAIDETEENVRKFIMGGK